MEHQTITTEGKEAILVAITLVCMLQMSSTDEQVQEGATSRCSTTNSDFMKKSGGGGVGVPGHPMDTPGCAHEM